MVFINSLAPFLFCPTISGEADKPAGVRGSSRTAHSWRRGGGGGDINEGDTFHPFPPIVAKANKNPLPPLGWEAEKRGGARRMGP